MKRIIITFLLIVFISGCYRDATPFSGAYKLPSTNITALVLNYDLRLMIGLDTCIFYDLHFIDEVKISWDGSPVKEDDIIYIYGITFSKYLNRLSYTKFLELPSSLNFELDESYGKSLIAFFRGNKSVEIGGLKFIKPEQLEECEGILANYYDLLENNIETKSYRK